MADGKVVIDVDLESKAAEKSADRLGSKLDGAFQDKNGRWRAANGRFLTMKEKAEMLGKSVGGIEKQGTRASFGIGKLVTSLGLVALASKGIQMVTNALDGAISRYDTLNSFPLVMEQIGFSSQDADKAIQRLSDGIDGLPTTLDSVAGTAQRIAVMTGDLDGAVETTLALNNAFISSGSDSANAARGLDQYVQMLAKGEVDLQSWRTLQETMGVALNDTAKAFGFAGKSAQNDLYDALKEGEITFDDFNAKLIELSNSQDGFADRARTSSGGIRTAWTNVKTAVVKGVADVIGSLDEALGGVGSIEGGINQIKGGIKTFFSMVSSNMPAIVEFFRNIKDIIVPLAPLIAGVVASIASFAGVVAVTNSVKNGITAVKVAFDALKLAFVTNPIGLVIAAIVGLIAVLVIAYQKSETFRNIVDTAFNAIKTVVVSVISTVSAFILEMWGFLVNWWQENNELIMSTVDIVWSKIQSIIQTVMNVIVPFLQVAWNSIKTLISVTWDFIKMYIQNALTLITGVIKAVMQVINGDWSGAWQTIKQTFTTMWNNMKAFAKTATDKIRTQIKDNFQKVKQHITNLLAQAAAALVSKFVEMVSKARNKAAEIVTTAKTKFQEVKQAIQDKLKESVQAVSDKVGEMPGKVRDKAGEMLSAGKDLVMGLINGIKNMGSGAIDAITGVVDGVVSKAKNLLKIKSPSRIFMGIGEFLSQGLSIGIDKQAKQAIKSSQNLAKGVTNAAEVKPRIGIKNRLQGVTAPIGNVMPISGAFGGSSVTNNNYSSNYDDGEVKSLLKQLVEKDPNLYVNGDKLGEVNDRLQAKRTSNYGRRVALD